MLAWALLLTVGCSSAKRIQAPTRSAKPPENVLSFSSKITIGMTLAEVWLRLQQAGASNIVRATNPAAVGGKVEVIGADYFPDLYLFQLGKLKRIMGIGADKNSNTRMYLHIVESAKTQAVIIISDAMRFNGEPMVAVAHNTSPAKRYLIAYDYFPQWFDGVIDPLVIGTDLDETGVTLVARDRKGNAWRKAVILRCDGKKIEATPIAMSEALRCECLRLWKERSN